MQLGLINFALLLIWKQYKFIKYSNYINIHIISKNLLTHIA